MTGYIYAVECGGRVKIGFSKFPDKRFSKIASDAPFPCVLLGYWAGSVADELAVHDKFHAIRVHGEWFASTEQLLAFIALNMQPSTRTSRLDIREDDSPLAIWRKSQGKTMESLAETFSTTRATWCRWELGRVSIPTQKIGKLMTLTGLSFEDLTSFEPSAPRLRNSIPVEYFPAIVRIAERQGVKALTLEKLVSVMASAKKAAPKRKPEAVQ